MRTESAAAVNATATPPVAPARESQEVPDFIKQSAELPEPKLKARSKKSGGKRKNGGRRQSKDDENEALETLKEYIDKATVFRAPGGTRWIAVREGGRTEVTQTNSAELEWYLTRCFVADRDGELPAKAALETVQRYANARAGKRTTPYRQVFVRVGSHDDKFYLDLCDAEGRVVEIDASGWRIITDPPVYFARPAKLQPLPAPNENGSVYRIAEILNADDEGIQFTIAYLLGVLNPKIPYPALVITGSQGSAKTNYMQTVKQLVDPSETVNCGLPEDERNLLISGSNEHILSFDNISNISGHMSDILSRISTGVGFSHRELHSNKSEIVLRLRKPTILNGITDSVARADLMDRAMVITTARILPRARRTVEAVEQTFDEIHADVLGGLLDHVARGLRRKEQAVAEIEELPRMADFAAWVTACGDGEEGATEEEARDHGALWSHHDFLRRYEQNRQDAATALTDDDPMTDLLKRLLSDSAGVLMLDKAELHQKMVAAAGDERKHHPFLSNKRTLGNALKRAMPGLAAMGIEITEERTRAARLTKIAVKDPETWKNIKGIP